MTRKIQKQNCLPVEKTFYFQRFSSEIIDGIKKRFDYAYDDDIFTLSSISSPTFVEGFFSKTWFMMRPHLLCLEDETAEILFHYKENIKYLKIKR